MGQNNSRHRDAEPTLAPPPTQPTPTPDPVVGPSDDSAFAAAILPTKRSRRSSMGQSLRTLIKSKSTNTLSSIPAGMENSERGGNGGPSLRKRWRTSRRWSRAPDPDERDAGTHDTCPTEVLVPPVPEEGTAAVEDGEVPLFPEEGSGPTPEISTLSKGKHKEEQVDVVDRPSMPLEPAQPSTSSNIGTWMGGQGSLAQALGIPAEEEEVVISPAEFADDTPLAQDPTPPSDSAPPSALFPQTDSANIAPPTQHENRQFPPPGTLVVVQGVVHTTDVARPAAAAATPGPTPPTFLRGRERRASPSISTPRSSTPRSRLSSLVPRTPSMLSRPASMFEDSDAMSEPTSAENSAPELQSPQLPSEALPRAPVLSPSSIDVLGTLLSVAAAATATSLLNGQSYAAPTNSTSDSPNAPTFAPTPGLGNLSSFASGLGLSDPPPPVSGRERMRNVWSGLRGRLGMRGNAGPEDTNMNGVDQGGVAGWHQTRTRPDGSAMDAREIMLAEMARAFNLGLGLNEESGSGAGAASAAGSENRESAYIPASHPAPGHVSQGVSDEEYGRPNGAVAAGEGQGLLEVPEAAEGSFERFLIDLQADLRIALSGPEVFVGHSPIHATEDDGPSQPLPPGTADNDNLAPPPPVFRATVTDEHDDEISLEHRDSEHGDNVDNDVSVPHVSGTLSPGATADIESNTASRTEYRPGGGINWWRSYRFPPITAPQVHGLPATPTAGALPHLTASLSDPPSATATSPNAFSSTPPRDPATPDADAEEDRSNIVVPVIVVGLQSVNMDHRRGNANPTGAFGDHHAHHHHDVFGTGDVQGDGVIDEDMNMEGTWPADIGGAAGAGRPGTHRGRSWHSRAANALRSLRPGRRASRTAQNNELAGSRTFLIYVIGGYYPPDHSLITGADALDSFEALWELADLLGQVKPQTVTKDEIDKSGLEIISPATLEQYERDGKVASNCLDRCLICLDDYVPEDNLRLLSCRHAFHKTCVDQWLTLGKNNCPACRTTGVPEGTTTPAF